MRKDPFLSGQAQGFDVGINFETARYIDKLCTAGPDSSSDKQETFHLYDDSRQHILRWSESLHTTPRHEIPILFFFFFFLFLILEKHCG